MTRGLATVSLLLWSAAALAEGSRIRAEAEAYATAHQLPTRSLTVGPAARRVSRLFVPVLPTTYEEFHQRFTNGTGSYLFRYVRDYADGRANHHITIALNPRDNFYWARQHEESNNAQAHRNPNSPGYLMAVDGAEHVPHLRSWLAARQNDTLYSAATHPNCMAWLSNAEVAPGTALFHSLGLKRSLDGQNMKAKLLHGANHKLEVVGVVVKNVEEFNRMGDADLLGPPPASGVEDAVR